MAIVFNQPQTISQLLKQKLAIPDYQRAYKWQPKHVNQLIDDIFNHRTKHLVVGKEIGLEIFPHKRMQLWYSKQRLLI